MTRDLLLTEQATGRRGLLRTLIAAPVAAVATHRLILPAPALVSPDDAAARLQRHLAGVEAAMRDLFPGAHVCLSGNAFDPDAHAYYREAFAAGERYAIANVAVCASIDRQSRS